MSKRKKKVYDDDDGRVISSMNVDGMPWYNEKKSLFGGPKKEKEQPNNELPLTKQETRAMKDENLELQKRLIRMEAEIEELRRNRY